MTKNGKKYIVQQYGGLWLMTERNYQTLKAHLEKGEDYDLTRVGSYIGDIDCNPLLELGEVED